MYCDNCGAKVEKGKKFCDNCGTNVGKVKPSDYLEFEKKVGSNGEHLPYQPTPPVMPKKSLILALIMNLVIFPGFGQLYMRKLLRGLSFSLGFIALIILAVFASESDWPNISIGLIVLLGMLYLLINIDVLLLVRRFNKFVEKNLRVPRSKEKW